MVISLTVSLFTNFVQKRVSADLKEIGLTILPAVRTMTLADMLHDGIHGIPYRAFTFARSGETDGLAETVTDSKDSWQEMVAHIDEIKNLHLDARIETKLTEVKPIVDQYGRKAFEITTLIQANKGSEAEQHLAEFEKLFSMLEDKLGVIGEEIENLAKSKTDEAIADSGKYNTYANWLLFFGLLVGAISAYVFVRNLVRSFVGIAGHLNESSSSVALSVQNILDSSQTLSNNSNQGASAVQETAAALTETSEMVGRSADSSEKLKHLADEGTNVVEAGRRQINEVQDAMDAIRLGNEEFITEIDENNRQITEIVKVISEIGAKTKVINDIVFQTKLLSFNASVEAARAGEHGKGFSVVAEEVGNLAQMSGAAAHEISEMLDTSVSKVESIVRTTRERVSKRVEEAKDRISSGVRTVGQASESFEEIRSKISEMTTLASQVSTAAKEQASGVEEITKAMNMLDSNVHENATSSTRLAGTASSLQKDSEGLRTLMAELSEIVYGKSSSVPSPTLAASPSNQSIDVRLANFGEESNHDDGLNERAQKNRFTA